METNNASEIRIVYEELKKKILQQKDQTESEKTALEKNKKV